MQVTGRSLEVCLPSVRIFESGPHEHLAGRQVDAARLFGEAEQAQASSAQAAPTFPPSTNFHILFDRNWVNKQPLQGLPVLGHHGNSVTHKSHPHL